MPTPNGSGSKLSHGVHVGTALELDNLTSAPAITTNKVYFLNGVLTADGVNLENGGGDGGGSLDSAYNSGGTITVDAGAVTLTGTNQDTAVLAITGDGDSGGALITLSHTTDTRNDILGTGSTWFVTGQGAATFTAIDLQDNELITFGTGNDATIGWNASVLNIAGVVDFDDNVTLASNATITQSGVAGSTVYTITAGDVVWSDSSLALTDADNAESVTIINNTATTIGASASAGIVQIESTSLTSGAALNVQLTEGQLNGGFYYSAWDATGGARVFSVGENGDITATGTAGSDAITLTNGDVNMSDGSITVVDADNAASLSVTNDTATTASVFVLAGSGTFTGSTTSSFLTLTPSGLTSGTALYLPVASLDSGKGIHLVGNAVTSGILTHISSSAAGTQLTGAGRLFLVEHSGNASGSGVVSEIKSAAADETVVMRITASAALALGTVLDLSAAALTTGTVLDMSNLDALTTGKALHIDATGTTQTSGILVHIDSASTGLTGAGRLLRVDHTGASASSAVVAEIASAAADETVVLRVTASAALAAGVVLDLSGDAVTTGTVLDLGGLDALTTGTAINVVSDSATTDTRTLVQVTNDNTAAVDTVCISVQQDSTDHSVFIDHNGITGSAIYIDAETTTGVVMDFDLAALTEGKGIDMSNLAAITTGKAIHVDATGVTHTSGVLVHIDSASTGLTGAGRLLRVDHTGASASSAVVAEIASAAADETVVLRVTASAALAAGVVLDLSATAVTTGTVLDLSGLDALTTGSGIVISSNSSETDTRNLLNIVNDNTAATGTIPLRIQQDAPQSTNYWEVGNFVTTSGTITLWMGNGTTANGNLSGTAGDVIFNGASNGIQFCTGTTNWTTV